MSSERREEEVEEGEGEKSAINRCVSLDLILLLLLVMGIVFWGDAACASQSFEDTGPNLSA